MISKNKEEQLFYGKLLSDVQALKKDSLIYLMNKK